MRARPATRRGPPAARKCRLTWANALPVAAPDRLRDGRCQAIPEQSVSTRRLRRRRCRPGASAVAPPFRADAMPQDMLVGMAARSVAAARDRWRERELGSSKRAGSWSRQQARRLQLKFMRRHRRTLLMVVGATILMTPLTLLFSEGQRWFLLGDRKSTRLNSSH